MSSQETVPKDPAMTPSEHVAAEGSTVAEGEQSKKGAKKAEAKAKKEAEKARKAAEREAAATASSSAASEDLAKDNYGEITAQAKIATENVHLRELGKEHVG